MLLVIHSRYKRTFDVSQAMLSRTCKSHAGNRTFMIILDIIPIVHSYCILRTQNCAH